MRIEIIDGEAVINTIIADEVFAEQQYPGAWRIAEYQDDTPTLNPVPVFVSMRQARLALLDIGKLSQIDQTIASLPSPDKEKAEIEWQYSNEVQRYNGFVSIIGPSLGLSEADIDDLFILAGSK